MATPIARKELELRLKVVADTAAGVRAMNELAASAQRVEQAAGRAGAAVGGGGGGAGGAGGFGSYALGGIMAYAGQQGIAKAGELGGAYNDPFSTSDSRGRATFKALPGGETLMGSIDSISGRNALFQKLEMEHQQNLARGTGRGRVDEFRLGDSARQAALNSRAAGLAGTAAMTEGVTDRSTSGGERAFRERQRMLGLEKEGAKAARETEAAAAARLAAEKDMMKLEEKKNALYGARESTRKGMAGQIGADRFQSIGFLADYDQEIQRNAAQREAQAGRIGQAKQGEAQALYNQNMVGVRGLRSNAEDMEQRAARSGGIAQTLGGMDRFGQADAVESLELLLKYGPEMLSQEQIAQARAVAPQKVAKILEKRGAGSAAFARLGLIGDEDMGNPEALRGAAAIDRDRAAEFEHEAEKKLAESAASAGKVMAEAMVRAMQDAAAMFVEHIRTEMMRAKGAKS